MPDPKAIAQPIYLVDADGNMVEAALRATVFRNAVASASGNTALWTPATGKKFRLMRYCISMSGQAILAVGGLLTVKLTDGATDIAQNWRFFVPALSVGAIGGVFSPWVDLGNGILSGAANNVLNINLSAALTGGVINVICAGREE